jgi:hypothetical protein
LGIGFQPTAPPQWFFRWWTSTILNILWKYWKHIFLGIKCAFSAKNCHYCNMENTQCPPITAAWKGFVHMQQDLVNLKVKFPMHALEVKSSWVNTFMDGDCFVLARAWLFALLWILIWFDLIWFFFKRHKWKNSLQRRKEHLPLQGAPKALRILNFECSSYLLAHKKKCAIIVIFLGYGKLGKLA